MTKICPVRCRLAGGVSGGGDGVCSIGVCMSSFRFGGFTTPEAPAMPMRKGPGTLVPSPFRDKISPLGQDLNGCMLSEKLSKDLPKPVD